jgi:quinol monooxygenase YgiN
VITATFPQTGAPPAPVDAQTPAIIAHPQPANYTVGTLATALSVTATAGDGGNISYQWYRNTTNNAIGGTAIGGATNSIYTPSTATVGTTYYYVVVTNTNNSVTGAKIATTTSNVVAITITVPPAPVNAQTPAITAHPQPANYTVGTPATALSVTATADDGGNISYQWYRNTTNSAIGGTAVSGATNSTYLPSTTTAGTTYYYVVVTNTNNSVTGATTATATSRAAAVTVTNDVANEGIPVTRIWSYGGHLHIAAATDGRAHIYNVSGVLVKILTITPGETSSVVLPRGIYVVAVGGKTYKVVVSE